MTNRLMPKYCPYCGGDKLKFVSRVPRCINQDCRIVFMLDYLRQARRSPTIIEEGAMKLIRTSRDHKYKTSRDYERLFRLAGTVSIVCFVSNLSCRDVAATLFTSDSFEVSARGISYLSAYNKEDFIRGCSGIDLEWIVI